MYLGSKARTYPLFYSIKDHLEGRGVGHWVGPAIWSINYIPTLQDKTSKCEQLLYSSFEMAHICILVYSDYSTIQMCTMSKLKSLIFDYICCPYRLIDQEYWGRGPAYPFWPNPVLQIQMGFLQWQLATRLTLKGKCYLYSHLEIFCKINCMYYTVP